MADTAAGAVIVALDNGPLEVRGVADFRNAQGDSIALEGRSYLCRCGGSANKPFCDGTHRKIGFSSARLDTTPGKTRDYIGKAITVHDHRAACAHTGFCTEGSPAVFDAKGKPWINSDGEPAAALMATVRKCPSGALSYSVNGVLQPDPKRSPAIMLMKDGPYAVVGGVQIQCDTPPASAEHCTLCRCGASKRKPYCDGSHWSVGFKHG